MDMAWNNVAPMIPKIIAAMCGCYCIVKASVVIVEKIPHLSKMIQAVGKETYVILAFSQIIIFYTNVFLKIGIIPKCTLLVVGLVLISYMKNHVVRIVKQK
jgi:fucose 4-O-acetylase-like acetyltransferase